MSLLRITLGVVFNPVFVLHVLNFAVTAVYHQAAADVTGYHGGIESKIQPLFSMESTLFGLTYTSLMVLLHCTLSGCFEFVKKRERPGSGYWD
jgi:hypothetical protein